MDVKNDSVRVRSLIKRSTPIKGEMEKKVVIVIGHEFRSLNTNLHVKCLINKRTTVAGSNMKKIKIFIGIMVRIEFSPLAQ